MSLVGGEGGGGERGVSGQVGSEFLVGNESCCDGCDSPGHWVGG